MKVTSPSSIVNAFPISSMYYVYFTPTEAYTHKPENIDSPSVFDFITRHLESDSDRLFLVIPVKSLDKKTVKKYCEMLETLQPAYTGLVGISFEDIILVNSDKLVSTAEITEYKYTKKGK